LIASLKGQYDPEIERTNILLPWSVQTLIEMRIQKPLGIQQQLVV